MEPTVEEVETVVVIDEPSPAIMVEAPEPEPEPKAEVIEEMELKLIDEYEHYFIQDSGQIYGFAGNDMMPVSVEDTDGKPVKPEFFGILDGAIYVSVKTMEIGDAIPDTEPVEYEAVEVFDYFKQANGEIKAIENFPPFSDPYQVELSEGLFKIVSSESSGLDISMVYQDTAYKNYLPVDGAFVCGDTLWYHVSETYSIRLDGLYKWKLDDNPVRVMEHGRLW
jgi:hypothetical protein